jgi:hypothetical protein
LTIQQGSFLIDRLSDFSHEKDGYSIDENGNVRGDNFESYY